MALRWTVPCTTPHSGDDGLGEPPQSMEWWNGIAWTPPLTFVVDLWLLLAGGISAIARLTLTNCAVLFSVTQPVAVTGRRYLRHRPVVCAILCSFTQPVAVTGRSYLRHRPVETNH